MSEAPVPAPETWRPSDTELFATYGDAFVPRGREQISTVCDLLTGLPNPHVLDLCCGEGRLAEEYLRRRPEGRVTLLDGSPEMLGPAAERLAPFGDRHTRVRADIEDREWREGATYGGIKRSLPHAGAGRTGRIASCSLPAIPQTPLRFPAVRWRVAASASGACAPARSRCPRRSHSEIEAQRAVRTSALPSGLHPRPAPPRPPLSPSRRRPASASPPPRPGHAAGR